MSIADKDDYFETGSSFGGSEMKITVYSCYFKPAKIFENEVIRPLQVGAALSSQRLEMFRDDEEENISHLNRSFNELTGIYWAWKNDTTSDYIGICHYRRFFAFAENLNDRETQAGLLHADDFSGDFENDYGLNSDRVRHIASNYDVILPNRLNLSDAFGKKSASSHYKSAMYHNGLHLDLARRVLSELAPDDLKYFDQAMDDKYLYPCNMFLMSRSNFDNYCKWIFPLLFSLDKKIDVIGMSYQERRAVGFLAERLFTAYVAKLRDQNPPLRIYECPIVFVDDTSDDPQEPPLPDTNLPVITVVSNIDDFYAPHAAALAVSIGKTIEQGVFVDMIILTDNLSVSAKRKIKEGISQFHNFSVSFIDMGGAYKEVAMHSYFRKPTLFRLGLADLLKSRDIVLYFDADGIVLKNIAPLARIDLGSNIVAAAHDYIMEAFHNLKIGALRECGDFDARTYCEDYLKMGSSADQYFQAGCMVMDLAAFRREKLSERMISDISENRFWFLDQDILNKHVVGRVRELDINWNVYEMPVGLVNYLDNAAQSAFERGAQDPYFIHFAGEAKPWKSLAHPRSSDYWKCLRETPFYEEVLFAALQMQRPQIPTANQSKLTRFILKLKAYVKSYRIAKTLRPKVLALRDYLKSVRGRV